MEVIFWIIGIILLVIFIRFLLANFVAGRLSAIACALFSMHIFYSLANYKDVEYFWNLLYFLAVLTFSIAFSLGIAMLGDDYQYTEIYSDGRINDVSFGFFSRLFFIFLATIFLYFIAWAVTQGFDKDGVTFGVISYGLPGLVIGLNIFLLIRYFVTGEGLWDE